MFVELNPGYTHLQVEEMPHYKMMHYLQKRIDRTGPIMQRAIDDARNGQP